MFRELGARFQIASGVDTPDAIEILYHWAIDRLDFIVTIRTKLDRENPEVDSVASICTATEWIEREMWELLGEWEQRRDGCALDGDDTVLEGLFAGDERVEPEILEGEFEFG